MRSVSISQPGSPAGRRSSSRSSFSSSASFSIRPADNTVEVLTLLVEYGLHTVVEFIHNAAYFLIDFFGGSFSVVAFVYLEHRPHETRFGRLPVSEVPKPLTHPEP